MNVKKEEQPVPSLLRRAIGSRCGIIEKIDCNLSPRDSPVVHSTIPQSNDFGYLLDANSDIEFGAGGKGSDLGSSLRSAIGEVLERYAYSRSHQIDVVWSSYADLRETKNVVDFEYLDIFDEEFRSQHLASLSRETEIPWAAGTNLLTGEDVYVPAELVCARVDGGNGAAPHFLGTSNGLAAAPSLTEALLWGIYESVERDGLMRTWWRQVSPAAVDVDQVQWIRNFVDRHIPHERLSFRLLKCDSIIDIPVYVGSIVNERDEYPKFMLCAAADLNVRAASTGAIIEAGQCWPWLLSQRGQYGSIDIEQVVHDMERNAVYYARPEHFDEVSFLFEGPTIQPPLADTPDVTDWSAKRRLEYLLKLFDETGCTPIAFDLTTEDVLQCGVRVARVFVPEFVRLKGPAAVPRAHPAFERETLTGLPHPMP